MPWGAALALLTSCTAPQEEVARPPLIPPGSGPEQTIPAPKITGWLHTDGGRILDESGSPVRLQGIQVGSLARGAGAPGSEGVALTGCPGWKPPAEDAYADIAGWGFNSVRLAVSWANLEPTAPTPRTDGSPGRHYDERYIEAVDRAVDGFTEQGVAVVLELAQFQWSPAYRDPAVRKGSSCQGVGMPVWLYPDPEALPQTEARKAFFADRESVQDGFLDAWRFFAGRYASRQLVVAFDMFNEPYSRGEFPPSALQLDRLYERIGQAIRSVNQRALLIFQDDSVRAGEVTALSGPPPFEGAVYSVHLYTANWRPLGLAKMQRYLDRARGWGVPLYIGEFDAFGYGGPHGASAGWRSDLAEMMRYCQENGISWNLFTYAPRWFLGPDGQPKPGLLEGLAVER